MPDKKEHEMTSHEKRELKKHEKEQERENQSQQAISTNRKKMIRNYAIIAVIVILAGIGLFALSTNEGSSKVNEKSSGYRTKLLATNLKDHTNLALHIHPVLEIELLGNKETIPANIGITGAEEIGGGGMRVAHTHDATGTLHIETPYPAQLYLKDFFYIWNKTFSPTCIFEYCSDDKHELKMFVNGKENELYENLPLQDKDAILIQYVAKEQTQ